MGTSARYTTSEHSSDQRDQAGGSRTDYTEGATALVRRERFFWLRSGVIAVTCLLVVFTLCILSGHYPCTKEEVFACLFHGVLDRLIWVAELPARVIPGLDYVLANPIPVTWNDNVTAAVWSVRVTRIVGVIFIGGGLAVSGACFQSLFRNPLVSESILGVTDGACFGAALAILLVLNSVFISLFAFIGGIAAVALTYTFSKMLHGNRTLLLVLTGTVVSSVFAAALTIIKYIAPTDSTLPEITYWLMGSFGKIGADDLPLLIAVITTCALILMKMRWRMNVLALGDDEARSLGINVKTSRGIIVTCATLIASISVCVCGGIPWVGLIIPQIARFAVGSDSRRMLPVAFFVGSIFLMIVDLVCRATLVTEIPVGVVTALVGAPTFFFVLLRSKTGWA